MTTAKPPKKPWRYYFVLVFPNSTKMAFEEIKTMVQRTHTIEAKEAAFLQSIAAKHPRNNLPPIISPFVGVFLSFLRGTTGLSLACLGVLALGLAYLRIWSPYGIYLTALSLAIIALLLVLLGITPFLGYKGASSRSWSYLKSFERAIVSFLVFLVFGVYLLEVFHRDIENALMTYDNSTHSFDVYRPSLFFNDSDAAPPANITSFVQAEFGKILLVYLQDRFETMFPTNATSTNATEVPTATITLPQPAATSAPDGSSHAFSFTDPLPWFQDRANKLLYPEPLKTTPPWMKNWVRDACSDAAPVNASYLDGNVEVHMEPTFASCLRPILRMLVDVVWALQVAFIALAALLLFEWLALLILKSIDPTSPAAPTMGKPTAAKKAAASSSSSIAPLLHVVLILVGLASLGISVCFLYFIFQSVRNMGDGPITSAQIAGWLVTGLMLVYSFAAALVGFLGCSPALRRAQTKALIAVVLLQLVLVIILYVIHSDTAAIVADDLHDGGRWDHVLVHDGINYFLDAFHNSDSTLLLDFLENECQLSMATADDMSDACQRTIVVMFNEYVHSVMYVSVALLALEISLLLKNMYYLHLRPHWRRLLGKKADAKPHHKHKPAEPPLPLRKEDSLPFHLALQTYLRSLPPGHAQDADTKAFTTEWLSRTGATEVRDSDVLFLSQFESIVRVLVLDRLTRVCGFEVSISISKDGKKLYAKLSASRRLLAAEAERRQYKVPFQDAVDPGPAFWTPREVATDHRVYDAQTAKQKLCSLYGRNLLLASENMFFSNESPAQIARRVNVHMRAAQLAPDPNAKGHAMIPRLPYKYPVYAPYYKKSSLQFLYKRHPNQLDLPTVEVAPSIFQTTDILRLVNGIVQAEMNTRSMVEAGLLESYACLHSASRFEWTNRASLQEQWLTYWKPRQLPGEPDPDQHYFLNFFCRIYPFRQPLLAVREYFGEQIAMYFLWLGFYAQCLLVPLVCSVLYVLWHKGDVHGYRTFVVAANNTLHVECALDDTYLGLCILVWSFSYAKLWQRKQHLRAVSWGMDGIVAEQEVRPAFIGMEHRDPITNEVERYFPGHLRLQLQLVSGGVMFAVLWAYYFVMVTIYSAQPPLVRVLGPFWGTTSVSICQVFVVNLCASQTSRVAYWLNDRENYRTQGEYEDNVILKIFLMQGITFYAALLFVTFVKHQTLGCYDVSTSLFWEPSATTVANYGPHSNCLPEAENLLYCLFLYRMGKNVLHIALPLLRFLIATAPSVDENDIESELELEPFDNNIYEDYAEIVVQFGLVVLFIFIVPLAPILAFLESAAQLRLDAYHLCCRVQRPLPMDAETIGSWFTYILLLSRMCIPVNLGVLFFTASNFASYSAHERTTLYLLCVAGGLVLFEAAWLLVPNEPALAAVLRERHAFLKQKYFYAPTSAATPGKPPPTPATLAELQLPKDADTFHALHARADLLERFNHVFAPPFRASRVEKPATLTHAGSLQTPSLAPLDLTGIDAIREAVRRSDQSLFDDDDTSDWYFSPRAHRAPSPVSAHRSQALAFLDEEAEEHAHEDDEDDEPYVFDEDDENLADVL
ncbi:hypothetical protein ACHHYP_10923 [Achlya hypogyna]|uniref:Anoctamin transmembrane domain-containing protein n=1 Tax=Achlya hypogyna TaxID=1202772 RepID=A0A1V9YK84_ACHHY|nr:hypothetical protein ACHHYP_10923 [Achlya hypogyna]